MINFAVRLKNKAFWIAIVPALCLLAQAVANLFGFTLDLNELNGKIIAVVEALFAVLVILGIVNDPTTKGLGDRQRALSYTEPWDDNAKGVK